MKRTQIYLADRDHRALVDRAYRQSRATGTRITMAELIRQAVGVFLATGWPKKGGGRT